MSPTLFPTFLLSLLASLDLCHLTGYLLILFSGIDIGNLILESVQLLANAACFFFLSLTLTDLTDGILNAFVALSEQFLRLFLGLAQDVLALALYLHEVCLQLLPSYLQSLFMLMDGLAFVLPIALVAYNVLQILVTLYIVGADNLAGIPNNFFGNACLAGNFYGKR